MAKSNVAPASWSDIDSAFRSWQSSRPWPEGRAILRARWMTDKELHAEGWEGTGGGVALDLNDGSILFASCDDEGNRPGVFFGISPKGEAVVVHPDR